MPRVKNCDRFPFAKNGMDGVKKSDRSWINVTGLLVDCSANIDSSLKKAQPHAHRWDYAICARKGRLHVPLYVEVHEISTDSIDLVIDKALWLRAQIQGSNWPIKNDLPLFVTGKLRMSPLDPDFHRLAAEGIEHIDKGDVISALVGDAI